MRNAAWLKSSRGSRFFVGFFFVAIDGILLLPTGVEVRTTEAGVNSFHAIDYPTRELQQFTAEVGVDRRPVLRRDRLQRPDDVLGEPDRHAAEREERRESGCGIGPERVHDLFQRPPTEGDQRDLSPREAPSSISPVLLANVERGLSLQLAGGDSEKPRTFGKAIRLGRLKEERTDATLLFHAR